MNTKKSAAIADYVLEKLSWHDPGEVTSDQVALTGLAGGFGGPPGAALAAGITAPSGEGWQRAGRSGLLSTGTGLAGLLAGGTAGGLYGHFRTPAAIRALPRHMRGMQGMGVPLGALAGGVLGGSVGSALGGGMGLGASARIERELMGTKPVIEATRQTVEDSLDNEEDSDFEIEKISSIADYVLEKISRKMVREDGKFKSFLKKKKKRH